MEKNSLAGAIKVALGATTVALSLPAIPVFAQDAREEGEAGGQPTAIEEILVTGSRIPRAGFDTMQPATSIDSDFIKNAGYTNIADVLNDHPMFVTPGVSLDNSDSNNVGISFADLYGLGSQRTLSLVNGRRMVSSNAPTVFGATPGVQVDLNSLPAGLIDRVEVVSIGGAPIYGSDAIAGTVNVILKDDYEGFEFDAQSGLAEKGDGEQHSASFLWGNNFSEGRGNITVSYEYNKQDGILMNDREFTDRYDFHFPNANNTGPDDGIPDRIFGQGRAVAIVTPEGIPTPAGDDPPLFAFDDNLFMDASGNPLTFGSDGRLRQAVIGDPTGDVITFMGGEGLRLQDFDSIRAPIERNMVNLSGHFDITDTLRFFSEVNAYSADSSDPNAQPFFQSALFGGDSGALPISINNPFLHSDDRKIMIDNGIDPVDGVFFMHKAMSDLAGANDTTGDNTLLRAVIGLEGSFSALGNDWNWDVSYNQGESKMISEETQLVQENFAKAIDVQVDGSGNITCVSNDPDCVPLNLLGIATDQAAIDYVTTVAETEGKLEQKIFSANITGELFDLHGGPLAMAVGYEIRDEFGSFQPDDFLAQGLGRSAALSGMAESFDTNEVYTELRAPVMGDGIVPMMTGIELEGAYRYIDHSQAGTDDAWSLGASFNFEFPRVGELTLRANLTESVRSPAITEAFLPISETFSFANDPCDIDFIGQGQNPDVRRAACEAEAAALGAAYDPTSFQSTIAGASQQGFTGGNPDLVSERAESNSFGFVFRPTFLDGFDIALDFVNIDIDSAIEELALTDIMEGCYDAGGNNEACDAFTRDPNTFQVIDFTTGFRNAGFFNFRGAQLEAGYEFTLAEFIGLPGDFRLNMTGFHTKEHQFSVTGIDLEVERGEIGFADWKWSGGLTYRNNALSASWTTRYIGESIFDNDWSDEASTLLGVDEYWLHHASVGYDFTENFAARLNVRNVFDNDPDPQNPFDALGTYDLYGRYINLGFSYKFEN